MQAGKGRFDNAHQLNKSRQKGPKSDSLPAFGRACSLSGYKAVVWHSPLVTSQGRCLWGL